MSILVLVLAFAISCFAAAGESQSKSFGFAVVWAALLTVLVSVVGTLVLKNLNHRTERNIGALIALCFMQSMFMLTVAVLAGGNLGQFGGGETTSAAKSILGFGILLFIDYATITFIILRNQAVLLPNAPMAQQDTAFPTGPPAGSYAGAPYEGSVLGDGGARGYDAGDKAHVHVDDSAPSVL